MRSLADFFEEIADRLLELRLSAGQKIRACMDGSAEGVII